jgi:hypothetical protein
MAIPGCKPLQPYIGDFILRQRPSSVVVETALMCAHGAKTGNVFCCEEAGAGSGFFPRMFCQLSSHLAADPEPAASRLWRVRTQHLTPVRQSASIMSE